MSTDQSLTDLLDKCRKAGIFAVESITVNSKDAFGDTPLHIVSLWGDASAAEALIRAGADVNATGDRGRTPLFATESVDVLKVLLAAGAKIDHRDDEGLTVSDLARVLNRDDVLRYLSKRRKA